jgi:hypothetical protein
MCESTTIYLIRPEFLCQHISARRTIGDSFLVPVMLTHIGGGGTRAASDVCLHHDGRERLK